jgi:hypothetical protein
MYNTDGWDFTENTELFDIDINHGEGGTAKNRMKSELSQVQGIYIRNYGMQLEQIPSYGVCK